MLITIKQTTFIELIRNRKTNATIPVMLEQLRIAEQTHYTKIQLEVNNGIVVLIPYYETCDMVRRTLTENDDNIDIQSTRKK